MVLTNMELWAADGASATSTLPLEFESSAHNHHLNPFNTHAVPGQLNSNLTHLSSNGYYGFSYINAAHNIEELNNNNNNNSTTYNFMANDVNGMNNTTTTVSAITTTIPPQIHAASAINFGCAANVAGDVAAKATRCKKRFFVMNDADDVKNDCTAATDQTHNGFAKRCRFDDDSAAQYCNDFFSLPSTQIATQSCYMDTEEGLQLNPQQQVVGNNMFENNNNNNNNEKFEQNVHLQLQHQPQQQEQSQNTTQSTPSPHQNQQQLSQAEQQHLYHQQQHYQDTITTSKYNFNNSCDTLPLKNNNHTCIKIDSQKNKHFLKSHKSDFKVDDATLFAQIHGGCLHHFVDTTIPSTTSTSTNNTDVVKHL